MKKRLLSVFIVPLAIMGLFSCAQSADEETTTKITTVEEARQAITAAKTEFNACLPKAKGVEAYDENNPETWSERDKITGAAWEAYYTGDTTQLDQLLKENGLTEKLKAIEEKYDLETANTVLTNKAVSRSATGNSCYSASGLITGDIFLAYGSSSSASSNLAGIVILDKWKHAGYYVKKPDAGYEIYHIFSASNSTDCGVPSGWEGTVGYEPYSYWSEPQQVAVQVRHVIENNGANGIAGYNYIKQFRGSKFHILFSTRSSNDTWYCSKIVYRAWLSQGVNVEGNAPFGDNYVTPQDIAIDNDTTYLMGDQ